MPITSASIKQRIDDGCKPSMGVTEDALFEANMSTPHGNAIMSCIGTLTISVPIVVPPPTPPLTPGGPATIVGLDEATAQGFFFAEMSTGSGSPEAIKKYTDPMGTAVYNILMNELEVECPPAGGLGVITLDAAAVQGLVDAIGPSVGVTPEGQTTFDNFAVPMATAIHASITEDMTVTFPSNGGDGVIA